MKLTPIKKHSVLFALVSMFVVAPVFGNDDAAAKGASGSCNLDGSWFLTPSSGLGPYMFNIAMSSHHEGSGSVMWSGVDPTVFGFCPDSVTLSNAQGAFARTGIRSFEYRIITFTQDALGLVKCIAESIGRIDLDRGCDSGRMNGELGLYDGADKNPFGDDAPFIVLPGVPEDYPMVRVTVDTP